MKDITILIKYNLGFLQNFVSRVIRNFIKNHHIEVIKKHLKMQCCRVLAQNL